MSLNAVCYPSPFDRFNKIGSYSVRNNKTPAWNSTQTDLNKKSSSKNLRNKKIFGIAVPAAIVLAYLAGTAVKKNPMPPAEIDEAADELAGTVSEFLIGA